MAVADKARPPGQWEGDGHGIQTFSSLISLRFGVAINRDHPEVNLRSAGALCLT